MNKGGALRRNIVNEEDFNNYSYILILLKRCKELIDLLKNQGITTNNITTYEILNSYLFELNQIKEFFSSNPLTIELKRRLAQLDDLIYDII